jgi:hypothetical protein
VSEFVGIHKDCESSSPDTEEGVSGEAIGRGLSLKDLVKGSELRGWPSDMLKARAKCSGEMGETSP